MKIFILEDMEVRKEKFRRRFGGANDLIFAETTKEAIEILAKDLNTFDCLFLDHDLGNEIFVDSKEENTGYTVAKWLQDKDYNGEIVIHSWNPVGAKNMQSLLPKAKRNPFIFL